MAATNYTPIQLYYSTTASQAPTAGNLTSGELAINITDGKLFYKDNGGVVQVIATKGAGTIGGSTTQIQYNNAGALAGSAAMTFNSGTSTTTLTTLNLTNALGAIYGGTAQSTYTQGDILYSSATNTLSKLGIGTVDYILTSTGSVPQWSAPSSISVLTATNLAGGVGGSVPYQSAASTTTFLAIGAANRVMTSTGSAPQWVTSLTSLTGVSSSSITNTSLTSGRVVYSTTGGAQTDSSNLTFNGTTLSAGGFSTTGLSTLVQTVTIGNSNFSGTAVFAAATPAKLYIGTGTVTDTTSAIGATNAVGAISSLAITPIAATNTTVTYTNAATLYIAGAPSAGTNVTLTNPYALYVNGGASYFGGAVDFAVTPSYSGGTANGVMYLNASKQITTGTALAFDGTNLSVGTTPTSGVQLYVYAPASTNAEVRVGVPTGTYATYTSYVNTTVTKVGTENSAGGALASGSSAYATVISNNQGYSVQIGTNNVIRTTVDLNGGFITTPIANGNAVFNENGVDADFRVESDNRAHMLFVDAGTDQVMMGQSTPRTNATLTLSYWGSSSNNNAQLSIDANSNSGTGQAVVDLLAGSGSTNRASRINFLNGVASTTTPRWTLINDYDQNGTNELRLVNAATYSMMEFTQSGGVVFNEGSNDLDFRVESDTSTHALFVDAGTSLVSVNSSGSLNNGQLFVLGAASRQAITAQVTTDGNSLFQGFNSAGSLIFQVTGAAGITANAAATFNEGGADLDFRVESDTNEYMLWVDASQNGVNIGGSDTIQGQLNVINATGDNVASTTSLYITTGQQYGTATNKKNLDLVFQGYRDGAGSGGGAKARIRAIEQTGNSRIGTLQITTLDGNGNLFNNIEMVAAEVCVNQDSNDMDFRVESDTNTHALFVDAGNSRVGILESNPAQTLDVNGIVRIGYALNQTNPVQNTWYDIITSMPSNVSYQVSLFGIKASNEEFAVYQTLYVIGGLFTSTRTAYYILGGGAGLEYRVLNNFPSANQLQARVTASGVSSLRASVLQMGG